MQSQKIHIFLDIAMITFIILASVSLIKADYQHWYAMILIMFAYLYYFLYFRFGVYFGKRERKYKIHELPKRQAKDGEASQSLFMQDRQKLIQEKSRIEVMRQGNDQNTSFANVSLMSRSRKANDSLLKSNISRSRSELADFNFLRKKDEGGSQLLDSFAPRDRGMNDSYGATQNERRQEDISQELRKITSECKIKYETTLKTLKLSSEDAKSYTNRIRRLCLELTKQVYQKNLQNFKKTIEALEQAYQIKIICKQLPELEVLMRSAYKQEDWKVEIGLAEVLTKLAKDKKNMGLPIRMSRNQQITIAQPAGFFQSKAIQNAPKVNQQATKNLQTLQKQRERLNSYFNNENYKSWPSEKILQSIQTLKQYIENQQSSQSEYYYLSHYKIEQQRSQRLLTAFNVTRNRLNELLSNPAYNLEFRKKCFMGWLRVSDNIYQIKETLNFSYGHPHYDLIVGEDKERKEYGCSYGADNGYSLLWVYLFVLQERDLAVVRGNKAIEQIYGKFMDIKII